MRYYLRLQFRRWVRLIKAMGFHPLLALLLLLPAFLIVSYQVVHLLSYGSWMYVFLAGYLFVKISDKPFARLIFREDEYIRVCLTEAIIFSVPFTLFLLVYQFYIEGFVLPLTIGVLSVTRLGRRITATVPTPFPSRPFEFVVGFRKTWPFQLLATSVFVISVVVGNFNLAAFVVGIHFLLQLNFYQKPEETYLVWMNALTPGNFLLNKTKISLLNSTLIVLPHILIMYLTFAEMWHITTAVYIIGNLLLLLAVLNKYAFYPNNSEITSSILLGMCILMPPALLIVIPYLQRKAMNNLKNIL